MSAPGPIQSTAAPRQIGAGQFSPPMDILDSSHRDAWTVHSISRKLSRFAARHMRHKAVTMKNAAPLVTFTFDDVPVTACVKGAEILERFGIRGTFYVSGGGCGATGPCGPLATAEQIRDLANSGHHIGCHTYSHAAVSQLARGALDADLNSNCDFITAIDSKNDGRHFAYPYGDYSWGAKRALEHRYETCRSVVPGINASVADLGLLKSLLLDNASMSRDAIDRAIAELLRVRGWLIFSSHDVSECPSSFGVSPDLLEYALGAALAAGANCVTIPTALALIRGSQDAPNGL